MLVDKINLEDLVSTYVGKIKNGDNSDSIITGTFLQFLSPPLLNVEVYLRRDFYKSFLKR